MKIKEVSNNKFVPVDVIIYGITSGLPSQQIKRNSRVLLIKSFFSNDYIVLKNRGLFSDLDNDSEEDYVTLKENKGWKHNYKELDNKKVIIDPMILNKNAIHYWKMLSIVYYL